MGHFLDGLRQAAAERDVAWEIVPCGPREAALEAFLHAHSTHRDASLVLLVDSECPYEGQGRWAHLGRHDGWAIASLPEEHCHLMVQCMETWLVADPEALRAFYGQHFRATALPARSNLEEEPKDQVLDRLKRATKDTQKGPYDKIQHGTKLLGLIDPEQVMQRAPHCRRLFAQIRAWLNEP